MENIKAIEKFDNPYDLLFDHDFDVDSNPEFSDYLKFVNDYSCVVFYVINFETVLCADDITGDVFSVMTISEFYKANIKEFQEYETGNN